MPLTTRRSSNVFGFGSLVISLLFWAFVYAVPLLPSLGRFKFPVELPATALFVAFLFGLVAAVRGSKWWLVALLLPLYGAVFLLSLRT